jgi:(p)ppGpp synthase/HD superfamily hydrolase
MNFERLLNRAIELARKAHEGQFDKAGARYSALHRRSLLALRQPYIGHPIRVMNSLATIDEKIVGVLHDAVEDSDLSLDALKALGFSDAIVEAIAAITKHSGEVYEDYLSRVMINPLALKVKIADMKDNLRSDRIPHPTEKDRERMKKYQAVLPRLLAALSQLA